MGHPNAISKLGVCYEKGEDVEKNYQEADNLYSIASTFHDLRATVKLFIFYLKGIEIERNLSNAVSYIQIAADFNYVPSFFIYELFFLNVIFQIKMKRKQLS
jgi:TPR repeat protein